MTRTTSILAAISLVAAMGCSADGLDLTSGDQALSQAHEAHGLCQDFNVPVAVPDVPGATIYAEHCRPFGHSNGTVLVMIHTSWHNHHGYDPPNLYYSQVRSALDAGFEVVNIDRLGTGRSTIPAHASLVTIDRNVDAIHGVAAQVRDGSLTGTAHDSVVWFGSSFGAMFAWFHADKYPDDFDGFVLQGIMHRTKPSFAGFALTQAITSVCDPTAEFSFPPANCADPSDVWLVNRPGFKGPLYYDEANAAPGMLDGPNWDDNLMRDVLSLYTLLESVPNVGIDLSQGFPVAITPDPATSASQAITKPTLLVVGATDTLYCGGPEGWICDESTVSNFESPYYTNAPVLDTFVPQDTGHVINLHLNGPSSMDVQNQWLLDNFVN